MDVQLANPFISSLNAAVSMFCGVQIHKESTRLTEKLDLAKNVHIFIGVTGDVFGTVILSADKKNAMSIASKMAGMEFTEFDEISISALQELLNITSGGAVTKLSELGVSADITPPTFMTASDLSMNMSFPLFTIGISIGDIVCDLNLSLKKKLVQSILIVDDSSFMRKVNKEIVSSYGFKVVGECGNGKECMTFLKDQIPNIILMDITMPEMDGLVTLEAVKKNWPQIKVIMVTALSQTESVQRAMRLGADGYVIKPVSEKSLLSSLKKLK